ncbi:hypothetical protein L1987_43239 [Smallanthus sonchifolius]|uniref:Uncharacterized protein n=1 Tax=Smallanthus sonchifolius TaxID=185202 RepID=A0ACB9GM92_9ASTR|nr:hypothetical protein L1987_43239 [Smallanthus sonchifolius]
MDMHSFDFNLFFCLHFAKPELPSNLREKIFKATSDVRKRWRKQEQLPPFCGLSKSAAKRRAKRYDKCVKCGNRSHDGKCSKNQTHSQHEYTHMIKVGDIRLQAKSSIRRGSNVYYAVIRCSKIKKAKTSLKHEEIKLLEDQTRALTPKKSNQVNTSQPTAKRRPGEQTGGCTVVHPLARSCKASLASSDSCTLSFPELPSDLREKIFKATSDVRKRWRKQEHLPPFCGLSKSAAKRRAKRYDKYVKCGNRSHDGKCSKNQTHSQHEYTHLIKVGDIRLQAESSIRRGSNVYYAVSKELALMRDLGLGNLTINESSD